MFIRQAIRVFRIIDIGGNDGANIVFMYLCKLGTVTCIVIFRTLWLRGSTCIREFRLDELTDGGR